MQKERTIGTTTLKTPYIGMGTWAIGGGTWWGENDDALSIRTIEEAIDRGIVWFDTAPVYGIGHSENVVGKAIKQNRSRILLSTKCGLEWDHETPCFHKVMEGAMFTVIFPPLQFVKIWKTASDVCRQTISIFTIHTGRLLTFPSIRWKKRWILFSS